MTWTRSRKTVRAAAILILGLGTAACGGSPATAPKPAASKPASAQPGAASKPAAAARPPSGSNAVTVIMNYRPRGYQAPYYVALKKGYYKAAGLDVRLETNTSGGASFALQLVATGKATFGITGATLMPKAVSKGVPVRFVGMYMQQNPQAFIHLASFHLSRPQQMVGKRLGDTAASGTGQLLPAFLRANHIKPSSVHLVLMSSSALPTALLRHKIDAYDAFSISSIPVLTSKGADAKALVWANWGFPILGYGVAASNTTIARRPKEVKAFVEATSKGYQYSISHPKSAVAIMAAAVGHTLMPTTNAALQQLNLGLALVHTKASKGHPLGWMAKSDWQSTIRLISQAENLKVTQNPARYYTDQFFGASS